MRCPLTEFKSNFKQKEYEKIPKKIFLFYDEKYKKIKIKN